MINQLISSINQKNFWTEFDNFCQNVGSSEFDIDKLMECISLLVAKLENDYALTRLFKALQKLGECQPRKALDIVNTILEIRNNTVIVIHAILKGIGNQKDVDDKIRYLFSHSNPEIKRQGYLMLLEKSCEVISSSWIDLIKKEINLQLSNPSSTLLDTITFVIARFKQEIPNAEHDLVLISKSESLRVQHAIITVLADNIHLNKSEFYRELLLNISVTLNPQNTGLCSQIQYLVLEKLYLENSDLVVEFIESWINQDADRSINVSVFEGLFVNIYNSDTPSFSKLITRWFDSDNALFHLSLQTLFRNLSVKEIAEVELSSEYISGVSDEHINYIIAKIVAYIYFKEQLRSMLYSILRELVGGNRDLTTIKSALIDYVIFNYPSTIDYLKDKASNTRGVLQSVLLVLIDAGSDYYEAIKQVSTRNEFCPSETRLKIYNNIYSRELNEKQKDRRSDPSSFLSMIKTIQLRTGKGMFSKLDVGYTDRTEMTKISYSAELPRGELIDPIGQEKQRRIFKFLE